MKRSLLLPELLSVVLSLLALGFGWLLIRAKLQERPSMREDLVLTVDEQRAMPADVMPVVLLQRPWNDENSLPFLMLKLVLSRSGEKYVLGYGETVMDTKDSIQHIAASKGLSSGNPTGLSVDCLVRPTRSSPMFSAYTPQSMEVCLDCGSRALT
jgi:hypothetical protein